jgi:hypothetical protein
VAAAEKELLAAGARGRRRCAIAGCAIAGQPWQCCTGAAVAPISLTEPIQLRWPRLSVTHPDPLGRPADRPGVSCPTAEALRQRQSHGALHCSEAKVVGCDWTSQSVMLQE